MEKILILADSSCDIDEKLEKELECVRIINLNIEMGSQEYKDRKDVKSDDIYKYVEQTGALPRTSQVIPPEFVENYLRASLEGYTDVICVTINSKGSSTFNSSVLAKNMFAEEYPEYSQKIKIHHVDSLTYAAGFGWVVVKGVEMIKKGIPAKEIADFMSDIYQNQVTMIGLYSLNYAKKSGRLNSTVAFVGEVLGLKPIMTVAGENKVIDKVRGDKALAPKMAQIYKNTALDIKGEYVIAYGDDINRAYELQKELKAIGAKEPVGIYPIGSCIAVNSGPKMMGMVFKIKK